MKPLSCTALFVIALPILTACASLTPQQCETGDWQNIGLADGSQGQPLSRLDEHREACGKIKISIDTDAYMRGRDEGLTRYCTPVSGFSVGRAGREPANVCPAELAGGFEAGYVLGAELNAARAALTEAEDAVRRNEASLSETADRIETLRNALVEEADRDKREELNAELRRLRNAAGDQRRQLRRSERERQAREEDLDFVREDSFARVRLLAPGWTPR